MRIKISVVIVIHAPAAPPAARNDQDDARTGTQDSLDASQEGVSIRCPRCHWHGVYDDLTRALKALGAHNRRCKLRDMRVSPFAYPLRPKK